MWETWVRSLGRENPLEKGMTTHFSILVGEFHGQRSLAGYSPWGHKESDMTERLSHGVCVGYANGVWVCAAHGQPMRGACVWRMDM